MSLPISKGGSEPFRGGDTGNAVERGVRVYLVSEVVRGRTITIAVENDWDEINGNAGISTLR